MSWKNSKRSMGLNPREYFQWLEDLENAKSCISYYKNWSCPPWIIERCGLENVLAELEERLGKPLSIKVVDYKKFGNCAAQKYYIVEVKK